MPVRGKVQPHKLLTSCQVLQRNPVGSSGQQLFIAAALDIFYQPVSMNQKIIPSCTADMLQKQPGLKPGFSNTCFR